MTLMRLPLLLVSVLLANPVQAYDRDAIGLPGTVNAQLGLTEVVLYHTNDIHGQIAGTPAVLIPPPDSRFGQDRWPPGTYRFEVVLATSTASLTVVVIGRANSRRV